MKLQFQKFPYLDVMVALEPSTAVNDLSVVIQRHVSDEQSAAFVLQQLVDKARKAGLQVFLSIEYPETTLPEVHRLTSAILSLPQRDNIYFTPAARQYHPDKFFRLFGAN